MFLWQCISFSINANLLLIKLLTLYIHNIHYMHLHKINSLSTITNLLVLYTSILYLPILLNVANYFHDDYVSLWILLSNYTPSINTTVPYAATTSAPENSLLSSNFPKFVETRGSSIRWCFPREDFSQVNNHE
jgi:hypothetical protein